MISWVLGAQSSDSGGLSAYRLNVEEIKAEARV